MYSAGRPDGMLKADAHFQRANSREFRAEKLRELREMEWCLKDSGFS